MQKCTWIYPKNTFFFVILYYGIEVTNEKLEGRTTIFKTENIKLNFKELSRVYEIDRKTVKKQYLGIINKREIRNTRK